MKKWIDLLLSIALSVTVFVFTFVAWFIGLIEIFKYIF